MRFRRRIRRVARVPLMATPPRRAVFLTLTAPGEQVHSCPCTVAGEELNSEEAIGLWNAEANRRWNRFMIYLRRRDFRWLVDEETGELSHSKPLRLFRDAQFFRVFESQERGALHVHAVLRLVEPIFDDPDGLEALEAHIRSVAIVCGFGHMVDVQVLETDSDEDMVKVARYLAKYLSKTSVAGSYPVTCSSHNSRVDGDDRCCSGSGSTAVRLDGPVAARPRSRVVLNDRDVARQIQGRWDLADFEDEARVVSRRLREFGAVEAWREECDSRDPLPLPVAARYESGCQDAQDLARRRRRFRDDLAEYVNAVYRTPEAFARVRVEVAFGGEVADVVTVDHLRRRKSCHRCESGVESHSRCRKSRVRSYFSSRRWGLSYSQVVKAQALHVSPYVRQLVSVAAREGGSSTLWAVSPAGGVASDAAEQSALAGAGLSGFEWSFDTPVEMTVRPVRRHSVPAVFVPFWGDSS
jgi:hypothetical protein